jgi:hypothetical protein
MKNELRSFSISSLEGQETFCETKRHLAVAKAMLIWLIF